MGNIINLRDITAQEEIFIQYFLVSGNVSESAYHANMLNIKDEFVEYKDVTTKRIKELHTTGNRCLKKDKVKERISILAQEAAERNSCATLDEILAYLTTIIRKSKENFNNTNLINSAISAINTLIKRYPNFEGSAGAEEKIIFKRGASNE